jgi:hypothetical protein
LKVTGPSLFAADARDHDVGAESRRLERVARRLVQCHDRLEVDEMEDAAAGFARPEAGAGITEVMRPIVGGAHEAHAPTAHVREEGRDRRRLSAERRAATRRRPGGRR